MNIFGNFGYIKVKDGSGKIRPVNIRSILIVEHLNNQFAPKCNSRIVFLDKSFMNIQNTKEEVDNKILKII